MNSDFRERVFLPFILPVGVVLGFMAFSFSLSRVLLTVSATLAVVIGIAVATYILLLAALVVSRPRIAPQALTVVVAAGMVAVLAAGAVSAAAGMRDLHAEEHAEGAAAGEGEGQGEGQAEGEPVTAAIPDDAALFVAYDIGYSDAPQTLPAGQVTIGLRNEGSLPHNVAFEELGATVVVEVQGGEEAAAPTELPPGEYTYFCTIPGHRAAGMEGTLTVS